MNTLRAALLLLALLSPGCCTALQATNHGQGPAAFGGARMIADLWPERWRSSESYLMGFLLALDLPFSLAADVLLLPVSIPWEASQGGIKAKLFPKGVYVR